MPSQPAWSCVVVVWLIALLSQGATMQEGSPAGASPIPDGTPLEADQFPRFVLPTHEGAFGFHNLLVLGNYLTVRFERRDLTQEAGFEVETWERTALTAFGGRPVSVFQPVWEAAQLRDALAMQRWGVDRPYLVWGDIVVPGAGGDVRRPVYLRMSPTNIPTSQVARVNETVQYASHAVNIWIPDFGQSRPTGGELAVDLSGVTNAFYDVFVDEYETIAIVSQTALIGSAWRRNVQNQISGLGLDIFDASADFGSAGVLQGVEVYPSSGWATTRVTLHQQAHQWGDYSGVWDRLGIRRQGNAPAVHTPLITPGAVLAGAVLEGTRRVAAASPTAFRIERTLPEVGYHPLTLYRMGLIGLEALPSMRVFQDQGQFDPEGRSAPAIGRDVSGGSLPVFASDLLAADGARTGPTVSRVRRALIYVSRTGLASQEEMDVVNFYGARLAAREGVTSWEGYPSYFDATAGLSVLSTDVTPRPGVAAAGKLEPGPATAYFDIGTDVLTGVLLDHPIPGVITAGQTIRLSGTVTADDAESSSIACFRFIRYGSVDPNEVFLCASLSGNRFAMDLRFSESQRGRYTVEPFLFAADATTPSARSRYGVLVVE